MSSSDRLARVSRRCALIAALALPLAGCFQPMYGPTAFGGADMDEELRAIAVDPIADRFGHYLANELIFALNGTGTPAPARYRLAVTPTQTMQTPIIDTVTSRAAAATIWARARYVVTPVSGGAPVATGDVGSVVDYDRFTSRFANVRAARDAEIRAARTLADQIRLSVAADFAKAGWRNADVGKGAPAGASGGVPASAPATGKPGR